MFELNQIILIFGIILLILGGGALFFYFRASSSATTPELKQMLRANSASLSKDELRIQEREIRSRTQASLKQKRKKKKKPQEDVGLLLFRAGYYTLEDRERFLRFRVICFIASVALVTTFVFIAFGNILYLLIGLVLGVTIGYALPMSWLQRKVKKRLDDVLYYLPLVIEQISIGVSSALDIGPCIAYITQMAEERDSHNPVTELLVHVERLVRSGLNLSDAFNEVGTAVGIPDVKHAFLFLAQCTKHGGEISKQLQELADSVSMQRQVAVEAKITALPVMATGPLAMVFAGFFILMLSGLFIRMSGAFG